MTTTVVRTGLLPDLRDWLETPMAALRAVGAAPSMRIEDCFKDNRYMIRADLPGIDPDRDVDVTVNNGMVTIRAQRREGQKDARRSEFHYGTMSRTLTLPSGVEEKEVRAVYDNGVLEVSFAMPEERSHRIPVEPNR